MLAKEQGNFEKTGNMGNGYESRSIFKQENFYPCI